MTVSLLGPSASRHEDGEDQLGKREDDVDDAHDQRIGPAAEITRDHAEQDADRQRDGENGDGDQQRDAGADDQPAEDVAAELVTAQQVVRRWCRPGREQVSLLVAIGRQDRREKGHEDDEQHDDRADHGVAVAAEAHGKFRVPEAAERALRQSHRLHGHVGLPPRRMRGSITP